MAFEVDVTPLLSGDSVRRGYAISFDDILSDPEVLIRTIVNRLADRYCADHYAEIERLLDPKVIAAATSVEMGARVTEQLQEEIAAVMSMASEAHRIAKRNR